MKLLPKARHIFISHSHQDAEAARTIAEYLQERGLTCWLDQARLRVGQLYDERIGHAIASSRVVLVLVSRAAAASDYVKHETTAAVTQKIPIAPVFLESVPKEELKAPLDFTEMRVHALNFSKGKLGDNLPRLAEEIQELLRGQTRRIVASWLGVILILALTLGVAGWIASLQRQRTDTEARLQQALAASPLAIRVLANPESSPPPVPEGGEANAGFTTRPAQLQFQVNGLRARDTQWLPLDDGDTLASGEAYFIRASPLTDGYLYIFQQDSTGKLEWLFPKNSTSANSSGANPVTADSIVVLPEEEDLAYQLDHNTGLEHLFAVHSASRWPELEKALESGKAPIDTSPMPTDVSQMIAARSKGIAGMISTGAARSEVRALGGRSLPAVIQPVAFRSKTHWLLVHRVIRHIPSRNPE